MVNSTKEIKEITKEKERYCKISTKECEVIVSSPHKEDSIKTLTKEASNLVKEHSHHKNIDYFG